MKRGPRPKTIEQLTAAGTFRPDRHAPLVTPREPVAAGEQQLEPPPGMSAGAKKVWHRVMPQIIAASGKPNADTVRNYAEITAALNKMWRAGEIPKSALLTEHRRLSELLGLDRDPTAAAPARSRSNRFWVNDRRNRSTPDPASGTPTPRLNGHGGEKLSTERVYTPRIGRTPKPDETALEEVVRLVRDEKYTPSRACQVVANGLYPFEKFATDRLRKKYRMRNRT